MTEHRPGVNPGLLTKHTLSLVLADDSDISAIVAEMDELPGVDQVRFDKRNQRIKVAYDASRRNISEMVFIVEKHGVAIKNSWWSRIKLGWQRQTDENIRGNAKHVAQCCNKPPTAYGDKQ